ncbi:hypothetical protein TNCV_810381 [Trichonephila clavipes]|uniref:Uncharacterized protein n=1 Tax=Trichonephila clavipes TaxID=2585209 RepID=A0A8X6SC18_TRICX|nr:hypothetical protein TNCV_810381 [Trichonephila clavipes]
MKTVVVPRAEARKVRSGNDHCPKMTRVYKLSENHMKRDESTEEKVEGELKLGEKVIRDTILSRQNRVACCMCTILLSTDLK